jgi:hypothetical protein
MLFPSSVKVKMKKMPGSNTLFQLERKDFKTLVHTTNFWLNRGAFLESSLNAAISSNDQDEDKIAIWEKKYQAEKERAEQYKTSFESVKLVSAQYAAELKSCTSDLQDLKSQKDKGKKKSFVKGMLWGLAAGVVGGIVTGAAL